MIQDTGRFLTSHSAGCDAAKLSKSHQLQIDMIKTNYKTILGQVAITEVSLM